jgi:mannose-6-phosphate isomerase-like protein (cupin superfamily)
MLKKANIAYSKDDFMEITDFGKGRYRELGLGLMIRVNEKEYGSKWLTLLPGQKCPNHHHKFIKETFIVMTGDVDINVDGQEYNLKSADKITIDIGQNHQFSSKYGAIIEEITTKQVVDDSYFTDSTIERYVKVE